MFKNAIYYLFACTKITHLFRIRADVCYMITLHFYKYDYF